MYVAKSLKVTRITAANVTVRRGLQRENTVNLVGSPKCGCFSRKVDSKKKNQSRKSYLLKIQTATKVVSTY